MQEPHMDLCPLAAEWGTVADWAMVVAASLAAVATVGAIVVALRASHTEHVRTLKLRDDEWARADARRSERAAVWAHTLNQELFRAKSDLDIVKQQAKQMAGVLGSLDALKFLQAEARLGAHLPLLRRRAGQLDDFPPATAAKLLNALSSWDRADALLTALILHDETPVAVARHVAAGVLAQLGLLAELIGNLHEELFELASTLEFVHRVTAEEIQADYQARRDAALEDLLAGSLP
ncbi:hypothetical protein CO641_02330 [Lysobacteraceae bacterium NML91-0213]|nr:hypothetical protein CO641_02330 [Xanthomonadaceae bacterium NML91-0213]